jgi:hypothetical protein
MADDDVEVPAPDAWEQRRETAPEPDTEAVTPDVDAAPGDAIDQARTVWPTERILPGEIPDDVPVADALEQSIEVAFDEDLERRDVER